MKAKFLCWMTVWWAGLLLAPLVWIAGHIVLGMWEAFIGRLPWDGCGPARNCLSGLTMWGRVENLKVKFSTSVFFGVGVSLAATALNWAVQQADAAKSRP